MSNITLKLNSVETRKSETKGSFTYARGTFKQKDGSQSSERTIMAFGAQRDSVKSFLRKNRTITVNAVFEGGVIKILGPKREPKTAEA